jgi:hypothetical protein
VPHSNFADQLQITANGQVILDGPLVYDEPDDDEIVSLTVTAWVTQAPAQAFVDGVHGIGTTCLGSFHMSGSNAAIVNTARWHKQAITRGGVFAQGWAFGSAEMTTQSEEGEVETYIWSQWVWLTPA